jgi:hypothetical protein
MHDRFQGPERPDVTRFTDVTEFTARSLRRDADDRDRLGDRGGADRAGDQSRR